MRTWDISVLEEMVCEAYPTLFFYFDGFVYGEFGAVDEEAAKGKGDGLVWLQEFGEVVDGDLGDEVAASVGFGEWYVDAIDGDGGGDDGRVGDVAVGGDDISRGAEYEGAGREHDFKGAVGGNAGFVGPGEADERANQDKCDGKNHQFLHYESPHY